ncbi:unnamed protein product [Tilletia controversa]|nr:unnamed protein product [Tilletia caries]CAD6896734.1 unnamed protein product [Tilletia controversa]CAD6949302.1 unnamed protein product [Tilletia laevis]
MSYPKGKHKRVDSGGDGRSDGHDGNPRLYVEDYHLPHTTHLSSGKAWVSSAARLRTITGSSADSSSDSGLSSEPTPTIPQQPCSPSPAKTVGLGRPSTSRFDSLHDLLQQAGYKETRIVTPQTHSPVSRTHSLTQSAAQQALALNMLSDSQTQQQRRASTASQSAANNSGWFSSLLTRPPRRTTSTSIERDPYRPGIPHSSSDPTISTNYPSIPTLTIDPCSPTSIPSPLPTTHHAARLGTLHSHQHNQLRPALRKRASRTSHALWTGSIAYRNSHTLTNHLHQHLHQQPKRSATVSGPTHNRSRPSLHAAFAASPTKSLKSASMAAPATVKVKTATEGDDISTRRAEFEAQYDLHRKLHQSPPSSPKEAQEQAMMQPTEGSRRRQNKRSQSTTALMAYPALPVLFAAPAVALRHEACLIPSSIALITDARASASDPLASSHAGMGSEQMEAQGSTQSQQSIRRPGLGRMRSVDLLRDVLDAMLRIRENAADPSQSLAAVDEVGYATVTPTTATDPDTSGEGGRRTTSSSGTLLSVTNSLGLSGETDVAASTELPQPVPQLFLSSPRGITAPQPVGFESILDPPCDEVTMVDGAGTETTGLGSAFLSLFGRGKNKTGAVVPPPSTSTPAPAPWSIVANSAGANGMINSASIEAELDRILAGAGSGRVSASPTKPMGRRGSRVQRPAIEYGERRSSSDSLEVIKPLRIRRSRRRSQGGGGGSRPSSITSADNVSDNPTRCMSPSQLDRIESALRGSAGTLSGARRVSALRSGVEVLRASRDGGASGATEDEQLEQQQQQQVDESSSDQSGSVSKSEEDPSGSLSESDASHRSISIRTQTALESEVNPFLIDSDSSAATNTLLRDVTPSSGPLSTTTEQDTTTTSSAVSTSSSTTAAPGASEIAVRKFFESLVELETPGGKEMVSQQLSVYEDEEDVLGPVVAAAAVDQAGSAALTKGAQPAAGTILSERPAHANTDAKTEQQVPQSKRESLSASSSSSTGSVTPDTHSIHSKEPGRGDTADIQASSLGSSAVIKKPKGKPHGPRKPIIAITHKDMNRLVLDAESKRRAKLGAQQAEGERPRTPDAHRSNKTAPSSPRCSGRLLSSPVAALFDHRDLLRPHVVLVADENYLDQSPTSTMLAQRQLHQPQHQRAAKTGMANKALRATTSQPVTSIPTLTLT